MRKDLVSQAKGDAIKEFFSIVAHNHQTPPKAELNVINTFSNATFEKEIEGFDELIEHRRHYPNDAYVLVSNHLSETDFIETMLTFMNNDERLLIQGGDNLFMDDVMIENDFMKMHFNLDRYLRSRGAFQIIRQPKDVRYNDEDIRLGLMDILKLNISYQSHLIKQGETILQYPGQSIVNKKLKMGRSYTGDIASFAPVIFQLLVDASISEKKNIHIVPMNISYESILEDANFRELLRMKENGVPESDIYKKDIEHVLSEYANPNRKTRYCLKFGTPETLEVKHYWNKIGIGKRVYVNKLAAKYFDKVMSMQTPFPTNVFFTAVEHDKDVNIKYLEEKIPLQMMILDLKGADMRYLKSGNQYIEPSYIIDKALERFEPRGIIEKSGDRIQIHREDVAKQYINHVAHFFK